MTDINSINNVLPPQSIEYPACEIADAVINTVANPLNPVVIAEDLMLAHKIAADIKNQIDGKHPRMWDIISYLFHIQK